MQDTAGSYPQPDSRNDNYFSVVSDLMSLVEHIQASMKMLESGDRPGIAGRRSGSL